MTPTEVMFTIVDTEHLHAELVCFERDLPRVKIGQKIRLTLAQEGIERTATVYLIGKEISAERTVRIHGHLDKEDHNLIPGMYLKAIIQTESEQVPSLPEEAVLNFEDKQVIIVQVSSEIFKLQDVTTGISENGFVQVFLPDSIDKSRTQVVVRNAYKLLSKMKNSDGGE
jgi:cobalt-zinc-cadmium efflux system membrane fusion protein